MNYFTFTNNPSNAALPPVAINEEVIYQENGKKVEIAQLATLIDAHL